MDLNPKHLCSWGGFGGLGLGFGILGVRFRFGKHVCAADEVFEGLGFAV